MSASYIAKGIESLLASEQKQQEIFDILIIGSGYGGSVAAYQFSGQFNPDGTPLKIAILERGLEYSPGDFPSSMSDIATHIRASYQCKNASSNCDDDSSKSSVNGNLEGLFDIRVGEDVCSVIANGLGGGSLINAGVMEEPLESVFDKRWPTSINKKALEPYYKKCQHLLGSTTSTGSNNTIKESHSHPLDKYKDLKYTFTNALSRCKSSKPFGPLDLFFKR